MADRIPTGITRKHILAALDDLDAGIRHRFAQSTLYDVLHEDRRYSPKAVIGIAAGKILGEQLGPYDLKGGLNSKCFRILEGTGFTIVTKGGTDPFPDEIDENGVHKEGSVQRVFVNKYERNPKARRKCIKHYGVVCRVCSFDFERAYGALGEEFIHVHHLIPISTIGADYSVNPIEDLRPVCPNCHAMIHKRRPPFGLDG